MSDQYPRRPELDAKISSVGVSASNIRFPDGRKDGRRHNITLSSGEKVTGRLVGKKDDPMGDIVVVAHDQTNPDGHVYYFEIENDRLVESKIKNIVNEYIAHVTSDINGHVEAEKYKFDALRHFQDTFDIEADDLAGNLKDALSKVGNLAVGAGYYPVTSIQGIAANRPEEARRALNILFSDSENEVDRFSKFQEIMAPLSNQYSVKTVSHPYNMDLRFMSLLLSLRHPDKWLNFKPTQVDAVYSRVYGEKTGTRANDAERVIKARELGLKVLEELNRRPEFRDIQQAMGYTDDSRNLWFAQDVIWQAANLPDASSEDAGGVDILALARKFVDYSDKSIPDRNALKVEYKGAKGRAWITVRDARRMEVTWFIFGQDNDEKSGDWDDERFGLLYSSLTGSLYLAHKWKDNTRRTVGSYGDPSWGDWAVYKVYDPHDIPVSFVEDFEVLLKEYEERRDMDSSDEEVIVKGLNTIIYGPPGTGKTHSIKEIKRQLIDDQQRATIDPLEGISTWGDAIMRVFTENDYRPLTVKEITQSPTMQAYAATRNSKTPYGTVSTQIIGNATEESTNSTYRMGTDKFHKVDGRWSLTEIGRAEAEELSSVLRSEESRTDDTDHFYKFVTFHQSYGYEEFIEGIRPETDESGQLRYAVRDGVFKSFCRRAEADPDNNYLFVIDEINRGNISKIFGELITLLEPNKRLGASEEMLTTMPYSGEKFGVPENVYVVGTMNTADRSIALLDIALRRRFDFKEIMPDPSKLSSDVDGVNLRRLLSAINAAVAQKIDRNHQIGHSYLMEVKSLAELHSAWYQRILPLLQEYFYDDNDELRDVVKSFVDGNEIVRLDGEDFKQALIGLYEEAQNTDSRIQL